VIEIKFIKYENEYILNQNRDLIDLLDKYEILEITSLRNIRPLENKKIKKTNNRWNIILGELYEVWSLLYLVICAWSNIIFAVSKATRKSKEPTMKDWKNVWRIFRYWKGTIFFFFLI